MRSIRLSLILYFLILFALAMGGVSWFVYQTTAQTLLGKQASTNALIQAQYRDQCKELKEGLDLRLKEQARTLAKRARFRDHLEFLYPLGMIPMQYKPQGYLNVSLWLAPAWNLPFAQQLYKLRSSEGSGDIVIEDADDLVPFIDQEEKRDQEYFQTFNVRGQTQQRSEKLGQKSLFLDEQTRHKADFFQEQYDDIEPEPGWKLRRVTLKANVHFSRLRFLPFPLGFSPRPKNAKGPSSEPPPGPPPTRQRDFQPPVVFVQYASETSLMNQKLNRFLTARDAKFAEQESETHEALAALRRHLLGIGLASLAGIVAGGMFLVRLGLAPLARLSDAVSQVSEKDFRLKVDSKELPDELKPIATRLQDTLEQLKRAFAREKQAAADISHELRTPLAAMMTTLELSLKKARSASEYREMLEDIRSSGSQMSHLVERLMALARLDAGADRLRAKEIDVRDIARECTQMIRPLAESRGLDLRLNAPESIPMRSDPDKLREILNNLLHNAVEYNRPKGSIDLNLSRQNGHVRLAVRDTGIGVSAEQREQIFERFFRADPSRHADTPHAGLGLSIVKSYVDLMGGTIGLDSGAGGSTFTVELPVS